MSSFWTTEAREVTAMNVAVLTGDGTDAIFIAGSNWKMHQKSWVMKCTQGEVIETANQS